VAAAAGAVRFWLMFLQLPTPRLARQPCCIMPGDTACSLQQGYLMSCSVAQLQLHKISFMHSYASGARPYHDSEFMLCQSCASTQVVLPQLYIPHGHKHNEAANGNACSNSCLS
jgi:hypothetical protein